MAYSTQRALSDGTLREILLTIGFIDREDINVYVDDQLITVTGTVDPTDITYEWITNNLIRFSEDIPDGSEVLIQRATQLGTVLNVFSAGASFDDPTMDENFLQLLYIAQEAREGSSLAEVFQDIDMHGYQLNNLGVATEPGHAVPLHQMQSESTWAYQSRVAAEAAAATAVSARNAAQLSESNAASSAYAAASSASAANTSATNASASAATAATNRNQSLTFRNEAEGFRDEAEGFRDDAADSAAEAAGYAAGVNLPSALGHGGEYLRQRVDEGGLEYRTITQMKGELGLDELGQFNTDLADASDPAKGAGLIGWARMPSYGGRDVGTALSSLAVSIWEFADHIEDRSGSPETWDWGQAVNAAIQSVPYGEPLYLRAPAGVYGVRTPIDWDGRRATLVGERFATRFNLLPGFDGDSVFSVGDRHREVPVTQCGLGGLRIDCGGTDVAGVSLWGVRDGSFVQDVYIGNFTHRAFFTKAAGDSANWDVNMSQGVLISNVHAISQLDLDTGAVFDLDALFESSVINCKALGFSTAQNRAVGFRLGFGGYTRGVMLLQCSVGGYLRSSVPETQNAGIHYATYAEECWDQFCTFESIQGNAVRFESVLNGYPKLCSSIDARLYNNPQLERLNPAYLFGINNNACRAIGILHPNTNKCAVRFVGGFNGYAELRSSGLSQEQLVSSGVVDLVGGSGHCVAGETIFGAGTRQRIFLTSDTQGAWKLPNGGSLEGTVGWTTLVVGESGQLRIVDAARNELLRYSSGQFQSSKPILSEIVCGNAYNTVNPLRLGSYHLWVDTSGRLRIKNGAPTSDTDGTVVGTQS